MRRLRCGPVVRKVKLADQMQVDGASEISTKGEKRIPSTRSPRECSIIHAEGMRGMFVR
jgi:hypothetical protein